VLELPQAPFASAAAARQEQFRQLLRVVLDEAAATSGYLYEWHAQHGLRQLATRGAAPVELDLQRQLTQLIESLLQEDGEQTTVTGRSTQGLFVNSGDQSYAPIVLRDHRDNSRILGLLAVASNQWPELDRGLLDMFTQTLAVLLAPAA
jgi:hypothetical protein